MFFVIRAEQYESLVFKGIVPTYLLSRKIRSEMIKSTVKYHLFYSQIKCL